MSKDIFRRFLFLVNDILVFDLRLSFFSCYRGGERVIVIVFFFNV